MPAGYHTGVQRTMPNQPPFEPTWLDELVDGCRNLRGTHPHFEDLYLERRVEVRVAAGTEVASCRSEGGAARWRFPSRWAVHAAAGVSSAAVAALVSRYSDRLEVPPSSPSSTIDLDPPRGWTDWARQLIETKADGEAVVRFLARRAVVIRRDGWQQVTSPPLVRLERTSAGNTALLAVWGQPRLGAWIRALFEPPEGRSWCPSPGMRGPVVFTEGTAGALLRELVGHLVEGDLIAAGRSPLSGLGGAILTEAAFDLVDDPGRTDLPGAFDCDDEGVRARPVVLLRSGRLCGLLCDRETAALCEVAPGRGRRADWRHPPVPRLTNLVVSAGKPRRDPSKPISSAGSSSPASPAPPSIPFRAGWCCGSSVDTNFETAEGGAPSRPSSSPAVSPRYSPESTLPSATIQPRIGVADGASRMVFPFPPVQKHQP